MPLAPNQRKSRSQMSLITELMALERTMWTNDVDVYAATYLPEAVLTFPGIGRIDLEFALGALRKENAEKPAMGRGKPERGQHAGAGVLTPPCRPSGAGTTELRECSRLLGLLHGLFRRPEGWRIPLHQQRIAPDNVATKPVSAAPADGPKLDSSKRC
jgi:hypothetical protein